jgi:hypothetical protein
MVDVVVVVRVILLRVTLDPGTLRDAISGMGLVQQEHGNNQSAG